MKEQLSEIIHIAGQHLMKWHFEGRNEGSWEGTQFKAQVDLLMHNLLVRLLKEIDSTIPVVSEEDITTVSQPRPDRYWLIDPIDGTASFVHGYPGFVTQAALMLNGSPQLAAIYAPALDLFYIAERGRGAFLNNKKLCCSPISRIDTLIDNYPEPRGIANVVYEGLKLEKYIECGSISLKMCKVADNSADLFIKDVVVRDWDIAPAQLVLEEAGGIVRNINSQIFSYDGDSKHCGIVATPSETTYKEFISWFNHRNKG